MRPLFLSIQGSYKKLEIALYHAEDCLGRTQIESVHASAQGLMVLEDLLRICGVALKDLSFIAVDSGPGAFTSLRVTIVTVNALAFATKIPLIEIDGLDTLAYQVLQDYKNTIHQPLTIVPLLNAYSQEVYTAFYKKDEKGHPLLLPKPVVKGSYKIEHIVTLLQNVPAREVVVVAGNAVTTYADTLHPLRAENVIIDDVLHHATCRPEVIAHKALERWMQGDKGVYKITPSYLKQSIRNS